MSLLIVGPNCFSNSPQAGHRKSSYSDSTALGSVVPSLVITLFDATRTDSASPEAGFLSLDITM